MKRDNIVTQDLHRYNGLSGYKGFLKGWMIPGFRYLYLFRKGATFRKHSFGWYFIFFILRHYSFKYGYQIPLGTEIASGFYLGHHGIVVINPNVIIGKNCNVAQNVTIGQANRGAYKGCPIIGDYVWIGAGAVIVGKVKIGSHVLIAPNSFVNRDIPDHSIVIGNPFKVIRQQNPEEGYINHILQ